jgi:hypothetical protein
MLSIGCSYRRSQYETVFWRTGKMTRIIQLRALAFVLAAWVIVPSVRAIESRAILKTYFETGDIPSSQDFADLIDSVLNLADDGLTVYRIGTDSSGHAMRLEAGAPIDALLSFAPTTPFPSLAPQWAGQFGFLPLELRDSSSASHYGFFQMQMASGPLPPPPGSPGPAISVQYLAFETNANTPITTFVSTPEPTSAIVFGCVGVLMLPIVRWGWKFARI